MFAITNAASLFASSRRARIVILVAVVATMLVLATIAQAGPATGGSVCPGCLS